MIVLRRKLVMDNKVPQQINDIVGDNVKKLAQLFPSAVKDGEVDFEALKEELGEFKEVGSEKYELTWAGKKNAKKIAQEDVIGRTLKFIPEDSKDADTTENLYIEGDNLEVLKLIRQNYYGAIKMIYIDPPYNTGKDFIYNDSFSMSQEKSDIAEGMSSDEGERYSVNKMSQNRFHANWLNMLYPRLSIAKELLKDEGVIFISIDDNEVSNLRGVCDEIFGNTNFIAQFTRKGSGGRQDSRYYAIVHEYILCYAKNANFFESGKMIKNDEVYPFYDEKLGKKYKTQLLRKWGENSRRSDRPNLYYPIPDPDGNDFYPMLSEKEEGCWRWGKNTMFANIEKGLVEFKKRNGQWIAYEKILEPEEGKFKTKLYTSVIDDISNNTGAALIKKLFNEKVFDYPKPIDLIYRIFQLANIKNDDIVLDFFSGSASTAHSVMKYNLDNKVNCKYIMIQYPERIENNLEMYNRRIKTICDIGEERIKLSGEKIKLEHPNANIDIGFKVFRTANTNIKWNSLMNMGQIDINQMETSPDTIDFMPGAKDVDIVYELMLRQNDVPLSSKIEQIFGGGYERTYLYADSYLVCLETKISNELIDKLAELDPLPIKFIFRDSAFQDDIALKDETFRRLKALIEKNHGMQKMAYTVEFL